VIKLGEIDMKILNQLYWQPDPSRNILVGVVPVKTVRNRLQKLKRYGLVNYDASYLDPGESRCWYITRAGDEMIERAEVVATVAQGERAVRRAG
jgi:hypothetical protein